MLNKKSLFIIPKIWPETYPFFTIIIFYNKNYHSKLDLQLDKYKFFGDDILIDLHDPLKLTILFSEFEVASNRSHNYENLQFTPLSITTISMCPFCPNIH